MFLYCSDFKAQANEGRTYSIRKISLLGQKKKKKMENKKMKMKSFNELCLSGAAVNQKISGRTK